MTTERLQMEEVYTTDYMKVFTTMAMNQTEKLYLYDTGQVGLSLHSTQICAFMLQEFKFSDHHCKITSMTHVSFINTCKPKFRLFYFVSDSSTNEEVAILPIWYRGKYSEYYHSFKSTHESADNDIISDCHSGVRYLIPLQRHHQ